MQYPVDVTSKDDTEVSKNVSSRKSSTVLSSRRPGGPAVKARLAKKGQQVKPIPMHLVRSRGASLKTNERSELAIDGYQEPILAQESRRTPIARSSLI
eukprot:CAMPEP_0185588210 /NCGR_PEP_ID=MMETSP0434-20130131/52173_1 /TAXON_ID=626734 ORGANISM="Favella taraikaensis, Strain Fe Narragansett Bay" /NCGR_SAMPLE_ID=MMETSP0434 /ASSEMBLY_ACC=CAM_ASM_000379 /LENGTH=97 /DNA_ID=CAMNT_0028210695 /DNA_START=493 /DNA_END=786 /DNA_ORIENTATION=-